jgi:hypothetical protein
MLTKLQIWWHRRRAVHHKAHAANGGSWRGTGAWHVTYGFWHEQQIQSLELKLTNNKTK